MDPHGMSLEDAIAGLIEAGAAQILCNALRSGRLTSSSTNAALETVLPGQFRAQREMAAVLRRWAKELPDASGPTIARLIEVGVALAAKERERTGEVRLVWTGPSSRSSFPRSSREALREVILGTRHELWLTAYWIAGPSDGEGIVADIVEHLADIRRQGANVSLVLDPRPHPSGETNFDVLRQLWPAGAPHPALYTWQDVLGEPHLKLHAKVIVADGKDALVTSANLTWHALERNIEIGVRLRGQPARAIAEQLKGLLANEVLARVPF